MNLIYKFLIIIFILYNIDKFIFFTYPFLFYKEINNIIKDYYQYYKNNLYNI